MSNQGGSENQIPSSLTGDVVSSGADQSVTGISLKDKLENLTTDSSGFLDSLSPKVRKRVSALQELQGQHDDLETKFFEERAALEARYQKLYEPLYSQYRSLIFDRMSSSTVSD